jgi:hypothetical protein
MDADLKAYLEAMETRMREHTEEMKRELREHTETVETRLLLEFWKWARQADARYRQHHSAVTGLDECVMLVEDRITGIERGERRDRAQ